MSKYLGTLVTTRLFVFEVPNTYERVALQFTITPNAPKQFCPLFLGISLLESFPDIDRVVIPVRASDAAGFQDFEPGHANLSLLRDELHFVGITVSGEAKSFQIDLPTFREELLRFYGELDTSYLNPVPEVLKLVQSTVVDANDGTPWTTVEDPLRFVKRAQIDSVACCGWAENIDATEYVYLDAEVEGDAEGNPVFAVVDEQLIMRGTRATELRKDADNEIYESDGVVVLREPGVEAYIFKITGDTLC